MRFGILIRRPFLWTLVLIITVFLLWWLFYPSLYQVAHGELPCFADESTHHNLRHMLFSFHKLMTAANLTYWIDYGTLLGSTRQRGIIPYDHDGDLGYLLKDMPTVGDLIAAKLKTQYGVVLDEEKPVQMRYKGNAVDLFIMGTYPDINRPVPAGKDARTLTRAYFRLSEFFEKTYSDISEDNVLPTKPCPFEGGWLMCPNNSKAVLATRYPYTYRWNVRVPFKLRCYLSVKDLFRILFYGA